MNITDVDDKTIKKAHDENKKLNKITSKYTAEFMEDLQALKILPADLFPAATDHIQNMIAMISILIENENAYVADDGSVFFSIDSINDYGKLANLDLKRQKQTDRVAADEYTKDNPRDFALWKAWKEEDGDVFWESPWGKGRPGWHMECSVMSTKYLGNHFDIHCGGVDNIFPHHENEIAQSCAALGTEFVNIWMHSEHLNMADEKMSKSLGNIKTIPELLDDGHSAESLRYALISSHYRSKLAFSSNKLDDARKAVHRINDIYNRLQGIISDGNSFPSEYDKFIEALVDDLNTPKALGILFNYLKELNRKIDNDKLTDEESSHGILFLKKADEVFSFLKDTSFVDTTLNINKHYRFNFLRKDNFGLLPFHNIGQTFNRLTYDYNLINTAPDIGFTAKQFSFKNIEDISYYEVPTPTSETSLTLIRAAGLDLLRSKINCDKSSIE